MIANGLQSHEAQTWLDLTWNFIWKKFTKISDTFDLYFCDWIMAKENFLNKDWIRNAIYHFSRSRHTIKFLVYRVVSPKFKINIFIKLRFRIMWNMTAKWIFFLPLFWKLINTEDKKLQRCFNIKVLDQIFSWHWFFEPTKPFD